MQLNLVCLIDTALLPVLLRRKIKALENPMFLGTTGERTIFQIMTRHGADIGNFSVRAPVPSACGAFRSAFGACAA